MAALLLAAAALVSGASARHFTISMIGDSITQGIRSCT